MIEIEGLSQLLALTNATDRITVIDFYADWCGPCQVVKPHYEKMAMYYDASEVVFTKCNVDRQRECASHFNVSAMPTFIICRAGEILYQVKGGEIGLVQRNVDLAVNYLKATRSSVGNTAQSTPAAAKVTGNNELAVTFLKIALAHQQEDMIEEKKLCDTAYHLLNRPSESYSAGALLIPYLASNAYSPVALDALLKNIENRENTKRYDGETIINQCLRYMVEILSNMTWKELDMLQVVARALTALAKSTIAEKALVESPFFYHPCILDGENLERRTILGALLGVGPVPKPSIVFPNQRAVTEWNTVMSLFPATETDHSLKVQELKDTMETIGDIVIKPIQQLLKGKGTRLPTLRWLGKALDLNDGYFKTMHHNDPLSSRYFMGQLMFVLVDAALPIFKGKFDYSKLPAYYCLGGSENPTVLQFDESIERIVHYDEENPLPKYPTDAEPYKPIVHLFFLATRAIMFAASFIDQYQNDRQQSSHPRADARQRAAFTGEANLYKVIMTPKKWAQNRFQFVNYAAQWLLNVMQVSRDGTLPSKVPEAWNTLPQKMVDSIVRATQMAEIDSLFIDGLISLMLKLMGNTQYFPKPHTHALFPSFLINLLQNFEAKRVLEGHPWFRENIVRSCIHCYIAVEKSTYERVQVRYELSHCIKNFLTVSSLCDPVREEFGAEGTVLEKFSHMAVAEVNESVDQLIEILVKMNEKMKAGADLSENAVATPANGQQTQGPPQPRRQREGQGSVEGQESDEEEAEETEGNETYHQLGLSLRNYIQLFNTSMDMFIELAQQFQKGVSQNMVALQISQMLCRSLVCFAGPKSKTLKIEYPERYMYQPKEILRRLVDCLTRFRRSKSFLSCVCQCGVPLPDIQTSIKTVVDRHLVTEDLSWRLSEMSSALETISKQVDSEEAVWNDAPDFALDALLSTPLLHPVALPSEVKDLDDLVWVNKDTLHHLLLTEPKHPFTKDYLDEKMVEEFNSKPAVMEAKQKLETAIKNWLEEAKKSQS